MRKVAMGDGLTASPRRRQKWAESLRQRRKRPHDGCGTRFLIKLTSGWQVGIFQNGWHKKFVSTKARFCHRRGRFCLLRHPTFWVDFLVSFPGVIPKF